MAAGILVHCMSFFRDMSAAWIVVIMMKLRNLTEPPATDGAEFHAEVHEVREFLLLNELTLQLFAFLDCFANSFVRILRNSIQIKEIVCEHRKKLKGKIKEITEILEYSNWAEFDNKAWGDLTTRERQQVVHGTFSLIQ